LVHDESKSKKENTLSFNVFLWNFGSYLLAFLTNVTVFYQNPLLCNGITRFKITFSWWNERKEFKNRCKNAIWKI